MKVHPRCFARSRPSSVKHHSIDQSIPHSKRKIAWKRAGRIPIRKKGKDDTHTPGGHVNGIRSSKLTVHPNLTLVLEIALVSDENHWEVILVFDPKDLLMELVDFLE